MRVLVLCLILFGAGIGVPSGIGATPRGEASPALVQTSPSPNTSLRRLRVLTWNVNAARTASGVDGLEEQLDGIWAARPDVVALQHVPSSDSMRTAIETGLEMRSGRPWNAAYHSDADTTTADGSMVLTWLPIDQVSVTRLPGAGGSAPGRPAAAIGIRVTVNSQAVLVATARLDADDGGNREAQLTQLQQWLEQHPVRRVVAADFSLEPGDAAWTPWRTAYQDAWHALVFSITQESGWTIDSRSQTGQPGRTDYQWFAQVNPTELFLIKSGMSTHHALVADYEVR